MKIPMLKRPGTRNLHKILPFVALFALIGTYFVIKSMAATPATANLWIDNSITGSCTRSATALTYAEASTSPSKTCSTFQAALNKTVNGQADTIMVKGGNATKYTADIDGITRNPAINVYAEPGAVASINYPHFTNMDGVTLDGTTGANGQGFNASSGLGVGANGAANAKNLTLKGFKLGGMLFMESCDTVNIDRMEIANVVNDDGIQMSTWGDLTHPCNNVTFNHMYIHDLSARCGTDHQDGIQIRGGSHITFTNSRIFNLTNCGSQGFFANQQGDLGGSDTTLSNTVISAVNGNAINFSSNPPQYLINNTIDGGLNSCDINKTPGTDGACPGVLGVVMKNNILNSSCAGELLLHNRTSSSADWANNVTTSNCGYSSQGDTTTSNFDAMFVNPNGSTSDAMDFHLKAGSFAIGKAQVSSATSVDLDGNTRDSSPDAGAYEYGATASTNPPANTAVPTISGTTTVGSVLTAANGTWSNGPTSFSYQWQRCVSATCTDISGATASTYTLVSADATNTVKVKVTATNADGSATATSAATATITASSTGSSCTTTVNTTTAANTALGSATAGNVVCISAGTYTSINISASKTADVTLQAVPGDTVTITSINFTSAAKHIILRNFYTKGITLAGGASFITLDHNDIGNGGDGILFDAYDCQAPGAPDSCGTGSTPYVSDVTISGNKIHNFGKSSTQSSSEDAVHIQHYQRIRFTANEFTAITQGPSSSDPHTDCLQSVYGGTDLTFDHNYLHDTNCQGFFVKDGDATNVTLNNNLFVRNNSAGISENTLNMYGITNLVETNNTEWSNNGNVLQGSGTATQSRNVFKSFQNLGSWTVTNDGTNVIGGSPSFTNTAFDDYRLSPNPSNQGVDWKPSDYTYGPTSGSSTGGGTTKVGDFNSDGVVNIYDLGIFLSKWLSTTATAQDLNSDGVVNIYDLGAFLSHYGS